MADLTVNAVIDIFMQSTSKGAMRDAAGVPKGEYAFVAASDADDTNGADYKCDGTDDQVQIQAAIDACSTAGGGIVELSKGNFATTDSIIAKDNVWLKGQGWDTVIAGTWDDTISVIDWDRLGGKDENDPHVNVWITDLKINGTNATNTAGWTSQCKGIFIQYMDRCQIRNVWVDDVFSTGIGTDFMVDCVISDCVVTGAGRGITDADTQYGGNGIGIGTGKNLIESLSINNCHVSGTGNNGIMFEDQGSETLISRYMHVTNCTATSSARGYRLAGVEGVTLSACSAMSNTSDGVIISDNPSFASNNKNTKECVITGCQISRNGRAGVYLEDEVSRNIMIVGNMISGNTTAGVRVGRTFDSQISNNTFLTNVHGVHFTVTNNGPVKVTGNVFKSVSSYGVYNTGSPDITVSDNLFDAGVIDYYQSAGSDSNRLLNNVSIGATSATGAFVINTTAATTNMVVKGNTWQDSTGSSFIVQNSAGALNDFILDDNVSQDAGSDGLEISGGTRISISGNKVEAASGEGIKILNSITLSDAVFDRNTVSNCNATGIRISPSGVNAEAVAIRNNTCISNGLSEATDRDDGIRVGTSGRTCSDFYIAGNKCYDPAGSPTQKYGLYTVGTVTNLKAVNNDFSDNVTGGIDHAGSGSGVEFVQNAGFNPQGGASITVGASPYTYTAGNTPETVYIYGGTVSDVSKDSNTIADATGVQVYLNPNEAIDVTYSSAPTMRKDRL